MLAPHLNAVIRACTLDGVPGAIPAAWVTDPSAIPHSGAVYIEYADRALIGLR